ncbi:MAG: 50S ribosomal protein L13 [Candidatus Marsarchaeota archaeon]|nr:50S ribosomal protein L13 [Candidatus Marsarchaeota archaeon]MCL5112053.1 50S ribosomal protein L13 [Candidatus Marsarchaeota archaeon]
MAERQVKVYDANGKVLGRLASAVAKSLLNGENAVVINSESAIISGSKQAILAKYRRRVNLKEKANPEHSPYWPRRPDLLVKRIIRGMLPYRMPRGKDAYRRLRVYIGVPNEFLKAKPVEVETRKPSDLYVGYITISELSRLLGYEKR